jgi:site-specific DNA-methyltransferase (adenine-specific)
MRSRLHDKTVDVVVTSSPYNPGVGYRTYNDARPQDEYFAWLEERLVEVERVLADEGSLFFNIGSSHKRPWNAMDIAAVARKLFVLQNEIIWVKSISVNGHTHGHFTPLAGRRYVNHTHEVILHFTKTGKVNVDRFAVGVPYTDQNNVRRYAKGRNLRCAGDVWFVPYETVQNRNEKGDHPAVFPPELAAHCIKLAGLRPGTVVLDPFCGVGNTLRACQFLGVKGIGIDIDPGYCRSAREQLARDRASLPPGRLCRERALVLDTLPEWIETAVGSVEGQGFVRTVWEICGFRKDCLESFIPFLCDGYRAMWKTLDSGQPPVGPSIER